MNSVDAAITKFQQMSTAEKFDLAGYLAVKIGVSVVAERGLGAFGRLSTVGALDNVGGLAIRRLNIPDNDPLLDNSILSALGDGLPNATAFGERNIGLLSTIEAMKVEFIRNRSQPKFDALAARFNIQVYPDPPAQMVSGIKKQYKITTTKRDKDIALIAASHMYGIRLVSGDHRLFSLALRSGAPNPLFRVFEGEPEKIVQGYDRARNIVLENMPGISPHNYTGSPR